MAQNLVGRILDNRYRFETLVGEGSFARVFRVHDLKRNIDLAAKVLRDDIAHEPSFVERFRREADVLGQLQHPNIVRYYGVVESEGSIFILLDYIDGTTLQSYLYSLTKTLEARDALKFIRPLCAALSYAHGENIIHRDVKPGNILLANNGQVYITDFGIARILKEASSLTQGMVVGTPLYMAPEQLLAQEATPAADIYSVGVVLYQILTGKLPFTGNFPDAKGTTVAERVAYEHVHIPPINPRQLNPAISPAVEAVILRCLRKEPTARFPSAITAHDALAEAVGTTPLNLNAAATGEHKPVPPDKTLPERSRVGNLAVPAAPPVPPAPVDNYGTIYSSQAPVGQPPQTIVHSQPPPPAHPTTPNLRIPQPQSPAPPPPAGATVANMRPGYTPDPSGLPYGTNAYRVESEQAGADNRKYIIGAAIFGVLGVLAVICIGVVLLSGVFSSDDPEPTSRPSANQQTATNIASAGGIVPPPPLSLPAQTEIVYSSFNQGDYDIYRLNFNQGVPGQLTTGPQNELGAKYSPDGRQIVYYAYSGNAGNGDIFIMNADGTSQRNLTNTANDDDRVPSWSPDGRQIVYHSDADGDFDLYVFTLANSTTRKLTDASADDFAPVWSPDGTRIAFYSDEDNGAAEIFIVRVDGTGREQVTQGQWEATFPAWTPDSSRLVFQAASGNNTQLYAINPDGGGFQSLFSGALQQRNADWERTGKRLLYVAGDEDEPGIFLSDFTTGQTIGYIAEGIFPEWKP